MAPSKLFIGRKIRELREANKATQAVFAERLGISTSSPMIGAVWTAVSGGGVVGAVLLPRLPARWPVGAITIGALTIAPAVLFVVATTSNTASAITALAVYSGWTFVNAFKIVAAAVSQRGIYGTLCDPTFDMWTVHNFGFWVTHFYISKFYEFIDTW